MLYVQMSKVCTRPTWSIQSGAEIAIHTPAAVIEAEN